MTWKKRILNHLTYNKWLCYFAIAYTAWGVVGEHATRKMAAPDENLNRASALAVRPKISNLKDLN